ncbi:MAG: hypothetical protein QM523_00785 [Candidatus Pacebacteria bacterium]|nr:hypothetical protein [Candidatus Paceibacterota bacterium]
MAFDPFLLRAQSLIHAGLFDDARKIYDNLIQERGETAELRYSISFLEQKLGNRKKAIKILKALTAEFPTNNDYLYDLAFTQLLDGKIGAAEKICQGLIAQSTDNPSLYIKSRRLLGQILLVRQKYQERFLLCKELIELDPSNLDLRQDYGIALKDIKLYAEAVNEFAVILEKNPEHEEAIVLSAIAHQDNGNHLEAIKFFDMIKAEEENDLNIAFRQCHSYLQLSRHEDAYSLLMKLPKSAKKMAPYWLNLGNIMNARKKTGEAIKCFRRGRKLTQKDYILDNNLALALVTVGRIDEAVRVFKSAIKGATGTSSLPAIYSNALFCFQYWPKITAQKLSKMHLEYETLIGAPAILPQKYDNDRSRDRPLRIGYISDDLVNHPVGFFVSSVIIRHDRSAVESFCYSSKIYEDFITYKIKSNAHHWRRIVGLGPDEVKAIVQRDKIDILVDLSGHTAGNHLKMMSEKPVPVQATWAGYVGTTGMKAMDWLIADRFHVPPELEYLHREKIWRMPHGYICFDPSTAMLPVSPLPALSNGFVTFCSFNNPNKLNEGILNVWAEILLRVPNSRLRLRYGSLGEPYQFKRVAKVFIDRGIDPARLQIENGGDGTSMYRAYQQCDIALDTSPYSGGLTTCEALWLGLPVVTFPGERFASRHSFSHVSNAGLTETIANSWENYVDIAVNLAEDIPHLTEIRGSLRAMIASSPLCDADLFVRDLESGFRHMWHDWLDGR